jgi:phosphoribosylformylglycinamidine synthase PurS subunit
MRKGRCFGPRSKIIGAVSRPVICGVAPPGRLVSLALERPTQRQECPVARVVVDVMLKPEILDPQGQAVANALPRLGVADVATVRIGKRIEIEFDGAADLDRAREIADKLLANPVIEDFTLRVEEQPEGEEQ